MHVQSGQTHLQAEFFGLLGLAEKASAGLEQHSHSTLGNEAGPSSSAGSVEFDSVYVETGFHPIKSEFDALQQQQTATMQVLLRTVPQCTAHSNVVAHRPMHSNIAAYCKKFHSLKCTFDSACFDTMCMLCLPCPYLACAAVIDMHRVILHTLTHM